MNPPILIEKFLGWTLPKELKEPILGDLSEEFLTLKIENPYWANYWYTRQAICTGLQFLTKTKRELIMFVFSMFFFFASILIAMIWGGELFMFINIPSFAIFLPPTILFTIAVTSKNTFFQAFQLLVNGTTDYGLIQLKSAKHLFSSMGNIGLLVGLVAVFIGVIAIGLVYDEGEYPLAKALTVSILTLFYAVILKAICYVAEAKIQFKIINLAS